MIKDLMVAIRIQNAEIYLLAVAVAVVIAAASSADRGYRAVRISQRGIRLIHHHARSRVDVAMAGNNRLDRILLCCLLDCHGNLWSKHPLLQVLDLLSQTRTLPVEGE